MTVVGEAEMSLHTFICNVREVPRGVAPGGVRFPVTRGRSGPGVIRQHPHIRISGAAKERAQRAEERSLHPVSLVNLPHPLSEIEQQDAVILQFRGRVIDKDSS